eukprot:GHVU01207986.1.p1 GENE.GHVU01207986.1~~GHVU01207986.1.p1  ORF type:complete len:204 (+),score=17.83 GHVU01207986.1:203-814(+)
MLLPPLLLLLLLLLLPQLMCHGHCVGKRKFHHLYPLRPPCVCSRQRMNENNENEERQRNLRRPGSSGGANGQMPQMQAPPPADDLRNNTLSTTVHEQKHDWEILDFNDLPGSFKRLDEGLKRKYRVPEDQWHLTGVQRLDIESRFIGGATGQMPRGPFPQGEAGGQRRVHYSCNRDRASRRRLPILGSPMSTIEEERPNEESG